MSCRQPRRGRGSRRLLQVESLESRRLLACGPNARRVPVTIEADILDPRDGETSLREAIIAANGDPRCNVIELDAKTYRLSLPRDLENPDQDDAEVGDLDISFSSGLDIRGSGVGQSIIEAAWPNGKPADRLIEINRSAIVSIDNVTLRGGDSSGDAENGDPGRHGGAIRSRGDLTLFDAELTGNKAQWGGAISIETTAADSDVIAEITDAYIHGNEALGHGGGISHESGKLKLLNSTVANNASGLRGGGVSVSGGTAALTSVTISGNESQRSGGGLSVTGKSEAVLINVTVYENTARGTTAAGGIDAETLADKVTLENSIVAGNAVWHLSSENTLLEGGMNIRGHVVSGGHNLFGDTLLDSRDPIVPVISENDLVYRNPRLAPLGMHGRKTPTHAPLFNSAAIDAGAQVPTTPATDQTGAMRCGGVDIGAVEYQAFVDGMPGDSNRDGRVDLEDLNNVRNHFGESGPCVAGDAGPFDGIVDLNDLNSVRNHFGEKREAPVERIEVTQLERCEEDDRYCAEPNQPGDDTFAIQYALNEARRRGETQVYIPTGRFDAAGLVMRGHALGLIGSGVLYLTAGSNSDALLTVKGETDPRGIEVPAAVTRNIATRDGFAPSNWIDGLTIDGNPAAAHRGLSMGLSILGDSVLASNLLVRRAELDPNSFGRDDLPKGINVLVQGNDNYLYRVDSNFAGHTGFRNVGDENYYVDIATHDFGCRGFRAQLDDEVIEGGAIFIHGAADGGAADFSTESDGTQCRARGSTAPYAPAAILIDPVPADDQDSDQRIARFELLNVDISGPDNIDPDSGQGALLKFAAVDEVLIEGSTFRHANARLDSIRVAEGNGTIEIHNSELSRDLFFEPSEPAARRLLMSYVSIGADFMNKPADDRQYSIDGLRVWDSFIGDHLTFVGFATAAIRWSIPRAPAGEPLSAAIAISFSDFLAKPIPGGPPAYALVVDSPHPELSCGRLRNWRHNTLSPEGSTQPTPDDFPCNLVFNGPAPLTAPGPTVPRLSPATKAQQATDILFQALGSDSNAVAYIPGVGLHRSARRTPRFA